jgi:translation initiation factor 4A
MADIKPEAPVASGNEGTDLHIDAELIESNWDTVVDNFDNMELKPELLRGIYAYGFE